jgi:hypothetical protein
MLMRVFEVIRPENIEFILFCFLEQTSKRRYDCQAKIMMKPEKREERRMTESGFFNGPLTDIVSR